MFIKDSVSDRLQADIVKLVSNETGIIGGLEFAKETFKLIDKKIKFKAKKKKVPKLIENQ